MKWVTAFHFFVVVCLPPGWAKDSEVPALADRDIAPFQVRKTQSGPWGIIEYSRLILEPPTPYIERSEDLKDPNGETVWNILAESIDGAQRILEEAEFDSVTIRELTREENVTVNPDTGWFEIRPSEEVILTMTPEQRFRLYPKLRPYLAENPYFQAFALTPGGIRDVVKTPTGLPDKTIELIEQLTYFKGKARRFSDIRLLFSRANSYDEKIRILKVLGREPDISARLILRQDSNLAELEEFWGAGGRNREVFPILRSVIATREVDRLDIAHLLPPTPRKLVHTYPTPWGYGIGGDAPDCFWSAFSFFSDSPPDRYLDFTNHVFQERYEPAPPPMQFGDLILIEDAETGDWIHACNYIADDLIFTKNGKSMGRAWIISKLSEVVNSYFNTNKIKVSFHRLKTSYSQ